MRVMVFGQKWFAGEVLALCLELGHEVVAVAVPADDDRLARAAAANGVPVAVAGGRLTARQVPACTDLILAAHAHCYIEAGARARARLGAIGYHPSLLPRHRGRDAVRWAIDMGDKVTGGTVYWLDDGADTGHIAAQDWCHIRPGESPEDLWRRELAPMGLRLFRQVLDDLSSGRVVRQPQDPDLATWEPAFGAPPLAGL